MLLNQKLLESFMKIHGKTIKNEGFTLVELIMVLVLVGLISTLAIPRYVSQSNEVLVKAKKDTSRAVKTAMIVAMADNREYPRLTKLASYVQADKVTVVGKGIEVTRKGSSFIVPTYLDPNCSKLTHDNNDVVQCVGSAP